ncbi:MAG: hypothetical protein LW698_07460 [Planctomycetaceae bacterium]|nr:hypothetical protein [Planctomycetaceae bacterium]
MSRRAAMPCRVAAAIGVVLFVTVTAAEEPQTLDFLRVHVPRGRLEDVPFGAGRYVPMSAAEFEQAVARFGPQPVAGLGAPLLLADRARYVLAVDEAGRLVGQVAFDVGDAVAPDLREVALGAVRPGRCLQRTAAGTGDAVVFGRPDGTAAVKTPEAGTYECELSVDPATSNAHAFTLPLVPALGTSVIVRPPMGTRPTVSGAPLGQAVVSRTGDGAWRIECGPIGSVDLAFVRDEAGPAAIAAWSDVIVRGGRVEVATALVPRGAWKHDVVSVVKPSDLRIAAVRHAADERLLEWTAAQDGRTARIALPRDVVGQAATLVVHAVAPLDTRTAWKVPLVRPAAEAWVGGGSRVEIDPSLGVVGVDMEDSRVVTPEIAARWPLPSRLVNAPDTAGAVLPAIMHFEHQAEDATETISVQFRRPQLDVARVTTVELSPGQVLGRAACDLRVVTGETFAVTARVAPGWIIDAVEMVDPFDLAADVEERRRGTTVDVDWRTARGRDGGEELRIGLALAATPRRSLGLRVVGHRRGVPLGGEFRTSDMDMVRFDGEAADSAVIDFHVGPAAIVEIAGAPVGIYAVPPRLERLVEPGTLRGRIPGGERAADRRARIVQRRPPLDVRVDVRLAARDERLAESFTLTCRPEAAAVDSVVAHFSEPMGDELEWSLVAPAGGAVVARRLDAADSARGDGARNPACVESWLVEITPAFIGAVTIRAAREVPFRGPQPVPLAWVEGAPTSRGTVLISDTGPERPQVVNRRLRELPPVPTVEGQPATLVEFAFNPPQAGTETTAAAELVPTAGAEARAWAWSETISCWCHDSGRAECEAVYDIENHGRDQLSMNVPMGRRVESVLLDGAVVPLESLDGGGTARVPLPPGRRRLRLVVRTLAEAAPGPGWWRVEPVGSAIDVPVLDHRLQLFMPPDLAVATVLGGYREVGPPTARLVERLFAARIPAAQVAATAEDREAAASPAAAGFTARRFVPVSGRKGAGIVVIRRRLVAAAAILIGFVSFLTVLGVSRRGPAAALLITAVTAAIAVWIEPPFAAVARAAWWGCLVGCGCRLSGGRGARPRTVAACLLAAGACALPQGHAADPLGDDQPLKVLLTPGDDGDMALVPEPLFRTLLRGGQPVAATSLRIMRCHVLVEDGPVPAPWRMVLDIDADAGGTLVLDQGPGEARWEPAAAGSTTVDVRQEGRFLRLVAPVAGSQRLEVKVQPAVDRRGRLETAAIRLPPAAVTRLELVDGNGTAIPAASDAVQCDRAAPDGPFMRAVEAKPGEPGFDLAGAARVRLVRPIDRRDKLSTGGLAATSENDVAWDLDACRVRARFEIAGESIIRAVVVAADAVLEPLDDPAVEGQVVRPLGRGRFLVERTAPAPGPARMRLAFRMPLVDPVGSFDVPAVWLEGADTDARTVRLTASPDLIATLETPAAQAGDQRDEFLEPGGDVWRYEAGSGVAANPRPRLVVGRRPQAVRGSQSLAVSLGPDGIDLRLQARIDATSTPLVAIPVELPPGCAIGRVTLWEDDLATPAAGSRAPLDLQWSMTEANRLTIVMQQPRAGRYRLDIDGRLSMRPASRGRVPLLRADLAGSSPLSVSWSRGGGPQAVVHQAEVPPGAAGPSYDLGEQSVPAADVDAAEEPVAASIAASDPQEDRVARVLVTAAIDDRGRLRGLARYDVVAARSTLRLRLPPRIRLFDVLVDGQDVDARPVAADAWDVQLHAAAWPRSMMVVFSGDLDAALGSGQPIQLQPPLIENVPGGEVLWTIAAPPDRTLRVAEPARLLDEVTWQAALHATQERIDAAFSRALAGAGPDADRLRAFAAARAAGEVAHRERAWENAIDSPPGAMPMRIAAAGDGRVTVRVVRELDASTAGRAAATIGLAVSAAWGWLASRRHGLNWELLRGVAAWSVPTLLIIGGGGWVAVLVPTLPGWLMLVAGATVLAVWYRSRHAAAFDDESTRYPSTHLLRDG